jgi:hydrogenase maturation protease
MNAALVDGIVKAVLYEGYMLYPYRPSSVKNQQRFNFGVVYPRAYSDAQNGTDAWTMQTQCLVQGGEETRCTVRVRFLRMVERSLGELRSSTNDFASIRQDELDRVEKLQVGDRTLHAWQEAAEELIEVAEFHLSALAAQSMQWPFRLSAKQEREAVRNETGDIVAVILRDRKAVAGTIDLATEHLASGLFKLTVHISNTSRADAAAPLNREQALSLALVSAHTILEVSEGEFVSLIDPPDAYRDLASSCNNVGTWPVLVGQSGEHDTMLSSPIILYDYPEIAPESPGDLFDGAEIDEILSLRIMTMTDDEKREMRQADDRTRKILERTESMPSEQFMKLHGALRGLRGAKGDHS